jgi:acetate---CoA ligase (ADP-forming) subunit beta
MTIIERALSEGRTTLSEYESKQLLAQYGIPITREILIHREEELADAMAEIGYPLVLKGCSPNISHKTEMNLIRIDIRRGREGLDAFKDIKTSLGPVDGVLVQEMVKGERELMAGLTRDPQFGPCVMFGLGGIFTEILKDVSLRLAPLSKRDALDIMRDIKGARILDAVRGMKAVDRDALSGLLMNIGAIGLENERVKEIDINPLIIRGDEPVAVDALVVLE